ncbi:hypothetical protein Tco_0536765 [Tanacetum coccineum]
MWIEADVPLLGELGEMGEPLGTEEDLAMLFRVEDDPSDDEFKGPEGDEEVWEMDDEWLMAPVTPPPMAVMSPPSTYDVRGSSTTAAEGHSLTLLAPRVFVPPLVIEDLCNRMGNLEHGHGLLVKKVITVSDAEVAYNIAIGEIHLRVYAIEGQATTQRDEVISELSQQVQTLQATVQHKDVQVQQLQTLVAEMSSCEGTLMQCILGLDRRLANVERRRSGPQ